MRYLSSLFLFFLLVSCKTLNPTTLHNATQHHTTLHNVVDTIVLRDSIYIREFIKGDTVYLTRTEFRDRWRTQIVHDTVLKTDSIVEVIEHPPREVIPPFYKRCTAIFWTLMALLLLYVIVRTRYSIK